MDQSRARARNPNKLVSSSSQGPVFILGKELPDDPQNHNNTETIELLSDTDDNNSLSSTSSDMSITGSSCHNNYDASHPQNSSPTHNPFLYSPKQTTNQPELSGFDLMEFKRGYGLGLFQPMKKENLDKLDAVYGPNSLEYHPPIEVTCANINNEELRCFHEIALETVVLVFEERRSQQPISQPGSNESKLDSDRWEKRGIKTIHAIIPLKEPGSIQAYNVANASECHYEVSLAEVFMKVQLTGITLCLYNNDKNYKSSHCVVNNCKDYLEKFTNEIPLWDLDSLLAIHGEKHRCSDGRMKRQQSKVAFAGLSSRW